MDPRTLGSLAAAAAGLAAFWARCLTHPLPGDRPGTAARALVRARQPLVALLLGRLRRLPARERALHDRPSGTTRCSRAGLSLAPGPHGVDRSLSPPAASSTASGTAVRLVRHRAVRPRRLWWLLRVGQTPDYAGEMLRACWLAGIGVGFVLPSLASAAASSVPARALRHRLRDLHDDAPARLRARSVDPRRRARALPAAATRSRRSTAAGSSCIIASGLGAVSALFIERKRSVV